MDVLIGITILSKKRKSVFDKFLSLIEAKRLRSNLENKKNYDVLENTILLLERTMQDIESTEDKSEPSILIPSITTKTLTDFATIFSRTDVNLEKSLEAISYSILALNHNAKNSLNDFRKFDFKYFLNSFFPSIKDNDTTNDDTTNDDTTNDDTTNDDVLILKAFEDLKDEQAIISENIEDLKKKIIENENENENSKTEENSLKTVTPFYEAISSMNECLAFIGNLSIENDRLTGREIILFNNILELYSNKKFGDLGLSVLRDTTIEEFQKKKFDFTFFSYANAPHEELNNTSYEWEVKINFKDEIVEASKISKLIWVLSSTLSKIDGVSIYLDDWGKGSYWAKLKMKIANWIAKEEVRDITNKARKAAEAKYFDEPISKNEKLQAEKRKIDREASLIPDKKILNEKFGLELEGHKLENQNKKEELRAKRLENKMKELDIIEKLSTMLGNEMIDIDSDFQIEINGLLYIEKKAGKLILGDEMTNIEKKGTKFIKGEDTPENQD